MQQAIYKVRYESEFFQVDALFVGNMEEMNDMLMHDPLINFGTIGGDHNPVRLRPSDLTINTIILEKEEIDRFQNLNVEVGVNLINMWRHQQIFGDENSSESDSGDDNVQNNDNHHG
jgi:hypothetical protein